MLVKLSFMGYPMYLRYDIGVPVEYTLIQLISLDRYSSRTEFSLNIDTKWTIRNPIKALQHRHHLTVVKSPPEQNTTWHCELLSGLNVIRCNFTASTTAARSHCRRVCKERPLQLAPKKKKHWKKKTKKFAEKIRKKEDHSRHSRREIQAML